MKPKQYYSYYQDFLISKYGVLASYLEDAEIISSILIGHCQLFIGVRSEY